MRRLARQQRHSRRTAQRNRAKVLLKPRPLLLEMLLHRLLILNRIEMQVLVVRHDEDEIRLCCVLHGAHDGCRACGRKQQCLCWRHLGSSR